ncbi:Transcription factor bHLH68 [Quillaja saponaria]|uniref:Transcription factor bHLH68 n=1 Tax=Quillaja saponaria TaxID=32244 RepID=A0AAD7Q2W3_QUISA|nr:Transcription factor bHLH68 [Quillaja saponaria]
MNRGVLQSSPVQQMMAAGNPNWWNINSMRSQTHQQSPASPFLPTPTSNFFPPYAPTTTSIPINPSWYDQNQDQLPDSWSLIMGGGVVGEEVDKGGMGQFQVKKLENWEEQILLSSQAQNAQLVDVKQENLGNNYVYIGSNGNQEFQGVKPTWSHQIMAASSPKSCVSTASDFSINMLDFSHNIKTDGRHPPPDRSSECNSTAGGGAVKKARVQPSSTQTTFKVRKEKLGDRITSLHQIVSPFGKTDTASVLLEAIGYIRFLQSQIEALSLPYLANGAGNMRQQQQSVQGERSCIFPEDPGQLLNDNCMKRKGACEQEAQEEPKKDLRSRGLCLVPVSCTLQVGSDNGADYWAPAFGGGFRPGRSQEFGFPFKYDQWHVLHASTHNGTIHGNDITS